MSMKENLNSKELEEVKELIIKEMSLIECDVLDLFENKIFLNEVNDIEYIEFQRELRELVKELI